ncbi:MAG: ABC transporter ATP-binding protein [Clostridia bacterium]|nr:ABC transporter ATP-binding protein [Clostridia bacterium]
MDNVYAVQLKGLTKTFGETIANDRVDLTLRKGEILSLLGENGSGKTTLMNMLVGLYQPDSGEIKINGRQVAVRSPEDAKKLGIGMVHQHFKLVEDFDAADNIWMGVEHKYNIKEKLLFEDNTRDTKLNALDYINTSLNREEVDEVAKKIVNKCKINKALHCLKALAFRTKNAFLSHNRYDKVRDICKRFGFDLDPRKKIKDMSVSEKQTVEIIKVLYYGADVIILDEPTAVLTVQEIEKFFNVLRRMRAEGHSIIIITHKLNEVMDISDRVMIMRKGKYIDTVNTKDTNEQQLTDMMVGKKVDLEIDRPHTDFDRPLLEIRDLTVKNDEGALAVDKMNFYIRGGEILGVAGISGCGQKELCEAIAGLRKIESGAICHKGESIIKLSPKQIIEKGISMSFIPEDRLGMGLAPSMSITDNMMLKTYADTPWYNPFVNRRAARKQANKIIEELEVVTPSSETPVRRLSGGNVQKVLVGREIMSEPNVIITAYPVRGLDINSSYAIYDILNEQKKKGVGILFVGEDLDVMLALCDKIMVMCHGKLMGVVHADKTTKEKLGLMMTGAIDLSEENDKVYGIAKDSNLPKEAESYEK